MCDFICNYNFNACMRTLMGIISWCRRVLMILYHHQSFHLQQRATRERIFGVIVSNALNLYVCSLFYFSLFSLHRIGKRNVDPNPCGIRFYSCKFFFRLFAAFFLSWFYFNDWMRSLKSAGSTNTHNRIQCKMREIKMSIWANENVSLRFRVSFSTICITFFFLFLYFQTRFYFLNILGLFGVRALLST